MYVRKSKRSGVPSQHSKRSHADRVDGDRQHRKHGDDGSTTSWADAGGYPTKVPHDGPPAPQRGHDQCDCGSSSVITVGPYELQATFENVVSILDSEQGDALDKKSVVGMVRSIYEWMVFDQDKQICMPSLPGSGTVKKMWPQGSRIDTRKRSDSVVAESSPRKLREVDRDCAGTVASSVVSSTLEEEGRKIGRGSIVVSSSAGGYGSTQYSDAANFQPVYSPYSPYHSSFQQPQSQFPYSPRDHTQAYAEYSADRRPQRSAPRYSIIAGEVEPPERVEETPQPIRTLPVRPVNKKKTRVGAAARGNANNDEGTEVVWEN